MFRAFAFSFALFVAVTANATDAGPEHVRPKEVGSRTVVLDFTVDENAKPMAIDLVSSEASGLNQWAKAMVKAGHVNTSSPGVVKLAEGKYRATISFPLDGDSSPYPLNVTLPKIRLQQNPRYPYALARADIAGGVLLRLTIDEKAEIKQVKVVRASHEEFGDAAVQAVNSWRLAEPAKKDGVPIPVTLFQLITFEIAGKPIAPWPWQLSPEPALEPMLVTGSFVTITPELIKQLSSETQKKH